MDNTWSEKHTWDLNTGEPKKKERKNQISIRYMCMIYHIKTPTVNDYEVKKTISYQGTSVNKKNLSSSWSTLSTECIWQFTCSFIIQLFRFHTQFLHHHTQLNTWLAFTTIYQMEDQSKTEIQTKIQQYGFFFFPFGKPPLKMEAFIVYLPLYPFWYLYCK